ncbi:MAG: hypothetical protein CMJ82_10200 [Planctomycetaceae bacterium]|nr:hypothetical protein [Planctomycetaceae bacterium]|tara:strand:+ start:176 stop:1189 length:1014 start_codon:yes stop_codon:yes gene_type:complete
MLSLLLKPDFRSHFGAFVVITLALFFADSADAQQWAKKMFSTLEHDFGTVAKDSKQEFRFEFTNLYKEDLHISGVRASCGCTIPTAEQAIVKTFEKGSILATYNTKAFAGARGATVTVTFDKPYFAEVQLQVNGFIRTDLAFSPSSLAFGEFSLKEKPRMEFNVTHAGNSDWMITDVRSKHPFYEVEILERTQLANQVGYKLAVQLKDNIPVGYLQDNLIIVTNDVSNQEIKLPVSGKVAAPVTLSPSSLLLGITSPETEITKRLILRADEPFTIESISCDYPGVRFNPSGESKKIHIVPITFNSGLSSQKIQAMITAKVNLDGEIILKCPLSATVE